MRKTSPVRQAVTSHRDLRGQGAAETRLPRWRRRAVLAVLGLSIAGNVVQWSARDTTRIGSWRSEKGKQDYEMAYDQVLSSMPAAQEEMFIPTTFGIAHVLRFGDSGGRPVLLAPGWGSGIPMWSQNLPALVSEHTVWALDAIGDAGLSTQNVPFDDTATEAAWIAEVIRALDLPPVHLVGHSFGGRIASEVALRHTDLVATLGLLEPVQVFATFPLKLYLWAIPATVPFLPQSWKDASLGHIGGTDEIDHDNPLSALIALGTEQFEPARPFPAQLTCDQLESLAMPVFAALGGASSMHDDAAGAERAAREHLRYGEVHFWPGGTHSLPMEEKAEVNAALLAFLDKNEPA